MKWFKHYSNASDSNTLTELIEELGKAGYAEYWLLIELLSAEFDGNNATIKIHYRKLLSKLRFRFKSRLNSFLLHLQFKNLIECNLENSLYEITAPILLELQSRDFKKARSERGQNPPKNKDKRIKNKESKSYAGVETPPQKPKKKGTYQYACLVRILRRVQKKVRRGPSTQCKRELKTCRLG